MRPLTGIKIVEMAGLAPSPYCGMILGDFGAEVIVVDRLSASAPEVPNVMKTNPFDRGKRSMRIDLKKGPGVKILKRMARDADVILEGYRPGVMESIGLGPKEAHEINPGLVYARLTGWGQSGPYSSMAGHDINYIAVSGALSLFRRKGERPLPPCNLLGDFAGGGLLCSLGIVLAILERNRSGRGQVVDSAMVDGAANLSTFFYGLMANGLMSADIGENMLDSGAPFYQVYETADGKYLSVGAIETRFYEKLLQGLGLESSSMPAKDDKKKWPEVKEHFTRIFRTKTRQQWADIFNGKDACVAPVLELSEVNEDRHNRERNSFMDLEGYLQPSPAPRLSRTPPIASRVNAPRGAHTEEILLELGYSDKELKELLESGIVE